jgi:hypothetical protein
MLDEEVVGTWKGQGHLIFEPKVYVGDNPYPADF